MEERKQIVLDWLKEKDTLVPTVDVYKGVSKIDETYHPFEVTDILEDLYRKNLVERDDGIFGFNTKWVYIRSS